MPEADEVPLLPITVPSSLNLNLYPSNSGVIEIVSMRYDSTFHCPFVINYITACFFWSSTNFLHENAKSKQITGRYMRINFILEVQIYSQNLHFLMALSSSDILQHVLFFIHIAYR